MATHNFDQALEELQHSNNENIFSGVVDIDKLITNAKAIDYSKNKILVHRNRLTPDPDNAANYPQTKIEDLKLWILAINRLLEDIIVVETDNPGSYQIIDGERRFHAIESMSDDEYNKVFPNGINCTVIPRDTDDVLLKVMQDVANYTQREQSTYVRRNSIINLKNNIEKLAEKGIVTDDLFGIISKQLGIHQREINRYLKTEKLSSFFEQLLSEGKLSINDASVISDLDEESLSFLEQSVKQSGLIGVKKSDLEYADVSSKLRSQLQKQSILKDDINQLNELLFETEKKLDTYDGKNKEIQKRMENKVDHTKKKIQKASKKLEEAEKNTLSMQRRFDEISQKKEKEKCEDGVSLPCIKEQSDISFVNELTSMAEQLLLLLKCDKFDALNSSVVNIGALNAIYKILSVSFK